MLDPYSKADTHDLSAGVGPYFGILINRLQHHGKPPAKEGPMFQIIQKKVRASTGGHRTFLGTRQGSLIRSPAGKAVACNYGPLSIKNGLH